MLLGDTASLASMAGSLLTEKKDRQGDEREKRERAWEDEEGALVLIFGEDCRRWRGTRRRGSSTEAQEEELRAEGWIEGKDERCTGWWVAEDEVDAGWIPMWIWWSGGGDEWIWEDPYKVGFGLEIHRLYIVGVLG